MILNEIAYILSDLGFGPIIEIYKKINAIDDQYGEGSGHISKDGKSWGDVTTDNWVGDPELQFQFKGSEVKILGTYTELRRSGIRGWISITTKDFQTFSIWLPK